jgi:hypothetical protein
MARPTPRPPPVTNATWPPKSIRSPAGTAVLLVAVVLVPLIGRMAVAESPTGGVSWAGSATHDPEGL